MENGKWRMENGKWKMENGKQRIDALFIIKQSWLQPR
jgi:hypothetical protein